MSLPLSCMLLEMIPLNCGVLHTSEGSGTTLKGAASALLANATHPDTRILQCWCRSEHLHCGELKCPCDKLCRHHKSKRCVGHPTLRIKHRLAAH